MTKRVLLDLSLAVVLLAFGAAASIYVAWLSARWGPIDIAATIGPNTPASVWPAEVPSWWPPPTRGCEERAWCARLVTAERSMDLEGEHANLTATTRQYGWPWLCMGASHISDRRWVMYSISSPSLRAESSGGFKNPFPLRWLGLEHGCALPGRPLLAGLLVNSVIYAGAGALVLVARRPVLAAVRGEIRRRRRRCASCGYDLRGLGAGATCPECGAINARPAAG